MYLEKKKKQFTLKNGKATNLILIVNYFFKIIKSFSVKIRVALL